MCNLLHKLKFISNKTTQKNNDLYKIYKEKSKILKKKQKDKDI